MRGIGQRIAKARARRGLSQSALAAKLGITRGAVSQWEKGETEPKPENLRKIADITGASYEWLAIDRGRGASLVDTFDPDEQEGVRPAPPFPDAIPQAAAVMGGGYLGAPFFQVEQDASTGELITVDAVRDWWRIPPEVLSRDSRTNPRSVAIFPMAGDSMEPTILRTDHVVIDTSRRRLEPDGIWAIDYGLGVTLKRLILRRTRGGDRFVIKSDNQNYPDEEYSPDEVTIVGRYVGRFTVY